MLPPVHDLLYARDRNVIQIGLFSAIKTRDESHFLIVVWFESHHFYRAGVSQTRGLCHTTRNLPKPGTGETGLQSHRVFYMTIKIIHFEIRGTVNLSAVERSARW